MITVDGPKQSQAHTLELYDALINSRDSHRSLYCLPLFILFVFCMLTSYRRDRYNMPYTYIRYPCVRISHQFYVIPTALYYNRWSAAAGRLCCAVLFYARKSLCGRPVPLTKPIHRLDAHLFCRYSAKMDGQSRSIR